MYNNLRKNLTVSLKASIIFMKIQSEDFAATGVPLKRNSSTVVYMAAVFFITVQSGRRIREQAVQIYLLRTVPAFCYGQNARKASDICCKAAYV